MPTNHSINGSVGQGGDNHHEDVLLVQQCLNRCAFVPLRTALSEDGLIGPNTIRCIEAFQRQFVGMSLPDGRIDVGGRSWRTLLEQQPADSATEVSDQGLDLLKAIEQKRLRPYDDQTGHDIDAWLFGATIGYGHLIGQSEWPQFADGITDAEADALFLKDLAPFKDAVVDAVTAPLLQHALDALVILVFNIGVRGFRQSSVLKLVNDASAHTSFPSLELAWKAWNKSQGRVSPGLVNRRAAEWKIYDQAIYERW